MSKSNFNLKASEYSVPVLGPMFLRYADYNFSDTEKELAGKSTDRQQIVKANCKARGLLFVPDEVLFKTSISYRKGRISAKQLTMP